MWIWPVVFLCLMLLVPLETYLVLRWYSGPGSTWPIVPSPLFPELEFWGEFTF